VAGRQNLLLVLPPLAFLLFAAVAYVGLKRENRDELPSALVGRSAPGIAQATAIGAGSPPSDADLRVPGVKLVNFWASWCGPCRVEHPVLTALADEGVPVIGINYKDAPAKALAFLKELGDPYAKVGADASGRIGLDWGIYGVPETFVVDSEGTVLLRFPGPLDRTVVEKRIRPAMAAALSAR
jgi:cytochrome c biogenesis protein CcmG/thiol:disulfide interchange protein DsbE